MSDDSLSMPNTVKFISQGVKCVAFEALGLYGLNMRSCQINLGSEKPDIEIQPIENFWRVRINAGEIWFDTDGESAGAIAELFGA